MTGTKEYQKYRLQILAYRKTPKSKAIQKAYLKNTGWQKKYLRRKRKEVVDFLGGKCVRCGFSDFRALQIDHINGGGSKERKSIGYNGNFHIHVKKSFEKGENKYQLLCANCNWIKRYENNEAVGRTIVK